MEIIFGQNIDLIISENRLSHTQQHILKNNTNHKWYSSIILIFDQTIDDKNGAYCREIFIFPQLLIYLKT